MKKKTMEKANTFRDQVEYHCLVKTDMCFITPYLVIYLYRNIFCVLLCKRRSAAIVLFLLSQMRERKTPTRLWLRLYLGSIFERHSNGDVVEIVYSIKWTWTEHKNLSSVYIELLYVGQIPHSSTTCRTANASQIVLKSAIIL